MESYLNYIKYKKQLAANINNTIPFLVKTKQKTLKHTKKTNKQKDLFAIVYVFF